MLKNFCFPFSSMEVIRGKAGRCVVRKMAGQYGRRRGGKSRGEETYCGESARKESHRQGGYGFHGHAIFHYIVGYEDVSARVELRDLVLGPVLIVTVISKFMGDQRRGGKGDERRLTTPIMICSCRLIFPTPNDILCSKLALDVDTFRLAIYSAFNQRFSSPSAPSSITFVRSSLTIGYCRCKNATHVIWKSKIRTKSTRRASQI